MIHKNRFKRIFKNINIFIVSNLRKKRNHSSLQRRKFEVTECFINFLKENYEVDLKFKKVTGFLSDFNVIKERLIEIDNHEKIKFFIKSFKIKINRRSYVRYISSDGRKEKIEKNPTISAELTTGMETLNSTDTNFLQNYVNCFKNN